MEAHGFDQRKTLEALMRNDANYITATYFLLAEGRSALGTFNVSRKTSSAALGESQPSPKRGGSAATSGHRPSTAGVVASMESWDGRDDSAMGVFRHGSSAVNRAAVAAA